MNQTATIELGTAPIGQLLRKYAMPAIIAMMASSLYNIVDSIYIGQGCSALAFSGLAVTFPFMNVLAAFGSLVGVGASALIAIKLGQKDYQSAQQVLGNVVILNVIISGAVGVLALLFLNPLLYFFGASEETLPFARSYMVIILSTNFFTHIYYGLNGVLRSAGHPKQSMMATIVAVTVNIILDPIFIFALDMGVQGAAVATVISQFIAIVWQFILLCNPKELLHFERTGFQLNKRITIDALSIGSSPFLMNLAACAIVIIINRQLQLHGGDLAIGAYGVINRFTFVFCMIVMGLNQAMQPIAGYNYGAQHYDRMLNVFYMTARWATLVTSMVFILGELVPEAVVRVFSNDEALVAIAVPGMRIASCVFFLVGYQMVTGNFFTSIGMAKISIFLSLTRQVLFLIPLLLLLPHFWGINGVWWSIAISDGLSCLVAAVILYIYIRRFRKLHSNQLL